MNKLKTMIIAIALAAIILNFMPNASAYVVLGPHRVWNDINENGIQDETEPCGIANVVINLYICDGQQKTYVGQTTTNEWGYYWFLDLEAGTYCEEIVVPEGYVITAKDMGTDDELDSDFDPATYVTDCITITDPNGGYCLWDCGLYEGQLVQGFTPGFWKHNIKVRLSHDPYNLGLTKASYNAFTDGPLDGVKLNDAMMDQLATTVLGHAPTQADYEQLLANLNLLGWDPVRTNTANAFNAAAGYGPY